MLSNSRRSVTLLLATLLVGSSLTLVGCPLARSQRKPPAPPVLKPTLNFIRQPDGGVCLSREDAQRLAEYIQELERR